MNDGVAETPGAAIASLGIHPIVISRLASPQLRRTLSGVQVIEAPTLRGRTAWPAQGEWLAVGEDPTWLGPREAQPPRPNACVTTPGTRPAWSSDHLFVADGAGFRLVDDGWRPEPTAAAEFEQRTRQARRLASHLQQVRGVAPAWTVTSPVALLLFPTDPAPLIVAHPPPPGVIASALVSLPEFPGGLRVEIGSEIERVALRSWTETIAAAVTSRKQAL